jgi:hypothetical protein
MSLQNKDASDGSVEKFKARFVAHEIDYDEILALIAS